MGNKQTVIENDPLSNELQGIRRDLSKEQLKQMNKQIALKVEAIAEKKRAGNKELLELISIRDSENCLRDILRLYQNVKTVLPNKKTPLRTALDFNRFCSRSVLIEMGANVHECEDGYRELSLVYYAI